MAVICPDCADDGVRTVLQENIIQPGKDQVKKSGDRFPGEDRQPISNFPAQVQYNCPRCSYEQSELLLPKRALFRSEPDAKRN